MALAERNMEGKPFFALDARGGTKTNKIEVEEVVGSEGGRVLRTRWIVDGHARWGLPADFEQDLYVAVLELLRRRGGPDERGGIEFTGYEVLDVMGYKQKNDRAYDRVRRGLKRIGHATIMSEMAFYSRASGDLISESFNLWSHRYVERRGRRGGTARFHRLGFHAVFLSSLREGYVDDLDAAFYRSLSRPSAKRLFRLLGERCGERGLWRVPLLTLRDLLPLSPEYTARSTIERKLAPAHGELTEKGFLKDVSLENEGKIWYVAYRLSPGFGARREVDRALSTREGRYAFERLPLSGFARKPPPRRCAGTVTSAAPPSPRPRARLSRRATSPDPPQATCS